MSSGGESLSPSSSSQFSEKFHEDSLDIHVVDGILAPPLVENPYVSSNEEGFVMNSSIKKSSTTSPTNTMPFLHPYPGSNVHSSTRLPNPPSLVVYKQLRFLIMDAPSETNLHLYIKEMEKYCVTDVVRVCDPSYPKEIVERHGIQVHELIFPDGEGPPESVINYWLNLIDSRFEQNPKDPNDSTAHSMTNPNLDFGVAIAIHCVAGLGRAPVLVAIALIEAGMSPFDAITYIRERRRGAINTKQLKFLESYRRRGKSSQSKCCIM